MEIKGKIRVLLVDDSQTVRMVLRDLLAAYADIEVAGEAADGKEALDMVATLNPDMLIMDVQMPHLNGFEATEQIMAHRPKPILILSSIINRSEVFTSLKAIELGALDVMEKPEFSNPAQMSMFSRNLVERIRMLSHIRVIPHIRGRQLGVVKPLPPLLPSAAGQCEAVGIGCSTGGPLALKVIISGLTKPDHPPLIVVQHITNGFLEGLADWLQTECKRRVTIASRQQLLEPGGIYLVPNGYQPVFPSRQMLHLDQHLPEEGGFRPSATVLFKEMSTTFAASALGVLLTGMGSDGAAGLLRMKQAGAVTVAQDQATSIVYGMPRAAVESGAAIHVLPVHQIPAFLHQFFSRKGKI